jgi:hypothetical protein
VVFPWSTWEMIAMFRSSVTEETVGALVEEKELERRVAKRRELIDHIDWQIRPPARFYEQLEEAIELAAQGRDGELVQIDRHRYTVAGAIDDWKLEGFVERARAANGESAEPEERD